MRVAPHRARGQTLPLWVLGVAAMCALMFFTANYASMVRWHIRAQNAADGAASAGIATDANTANQSNVLAFAATVEEARMRYLLQAIVNTVYSPGACSGTAACDAILAKLSTAYYTASGNYTAVTQQMRLIDAYTQSGLKNSPDKAAALVQANCTTLDCGFTYTTTVDPTNEIVDVVACKNVATLVPAILGLPQTSMFKALGRSALTLGQVPESFVPAAVNPATGTAYQPNETPAGLNTSAAFKVDYQSLIVRIPWAIAVPAHPKVLAGTYGCS
jgi:putative Flp pilus-assembly TadE/G-like protein